MVAEEESIEGAKLGTIFALEVCNDGLPVGSEGFCTEADEGICLE